MSWKDILTGNVESQEQMTPMAQERANKTGNTYYIWDANENKAGHFSKWRLSSRKSDAEGNNYIIIEPEELQ